MLEKLAEHDARMEAYLDAHAIIIEAEAPKVTTRARQVRVGGRLQTTVLESTRDLAAAQAEADQRDRENARTESPFAARNQGKYRFTLITERLIAFTPVKPAATLFVGAARLNGDELVELTMKPAKGSALMGAVELVLRYENQTEAGRNISLFQVKSRIGTLTMRFTFE